MVRIDTRAGSCELEEPLRAKGLPVEMCSLPAGDVEIVGRGVGGRPMLIGCEFKTVRDALTCMRDGRYAEQLRGMRKRYEVIWLLVEGEWRANAEGLIEVRERRGWHERGRFTAQEYTAWLLTMMQQGGALLWTTANRDESVSWLRTLYWWWTAKELGMHRAHLAWHVPAYAPENPMELTPPGVVQKVAAALLAQGPTVDVNGERARAVGAAFGSVRAMLDAGVKEWTAVDGIGAKTAKRVVEVLR